MMRRRRPLSAPTLGIAAAMSGLGAVEPIPAESPIDGALWTIVLPALLFATACAATYLLYRHFADQNPDEGETDRGA
jgi:hypothetical protein